MYAVIGIGGKQVRVSPGETVRVESLPVDPGTSVTFDQVLMIGGETGTLVGTPVVAGAKVLATVLEHDRAKKVLIFKKKRRKQYRRTNGHRQHFTAVRIDGIEMKDEKSLVANVGTRTGFEASGETATGASGGASVEPDVETGRGAGRTGLSSDEPSGIDGDGAGADAKLGSDADPNPNTETEA